MAGLMVRKARMSIGGKIGLWLGGIVLFIIVVFVGLWFWGSNDLNKKAQESGNLYPEESRTVYVSSCNKDAGDGYEDFCSCTLEYFEENYSFNEFKKFEEDEISEDGKSYSQIVLDATNSCSDKIPQ